MSWNIFHLSYPDITALLTAIILCYLGHSKDPDNDDDDDG